ncbi:MAG: hypothetical protein ACR2JS_02510 [Candidatus Nanopelagicales bacterium]
MDALWWFYTIVLGAAFAQIAMGMAVQWKIRAATSEPIFLPALLWLGFLLILTIEIWIAVGFYQRTVTSMSILSLLAFLWIPMGILVLSVFLAEPTWSNSAPSSDEERFARLRRPYFTVLVSIPIVNLVHEIALGSAGMDADLLFPVLLAAGAILGFFLRTRKTDAALAGVMLVIICVYLATSYGTVSIPA